MDVVPLHRKPERPQQTNFAGFDAIRALAALGVLLLHACVPYLQHPMRGLAWPVRDSSSAAVDVLFWGIELFIMPVFLVMAGILAWRSLHRHGPGKLVKTRARRLLIPLAFGMLVILPLDLYAWVLGWVGEGLVPAVKLKSLKFDNGIDRDLWGLSHLWFLQYLFLYVAVLSGAIYLAGRSVHIRRLMPATTRGHRAVAGRRCDHALVSSRSRVGIPTFVFAGSQQMVVQRHIFLRRRADRKVGPAIDMVDRSGSTVRVAHAGAGSWHRVAGTLATGRRTEHSSGRLVGGDNHRQCVGDHTLHHRLGDKESDWAADRDPIPGRRVVLDLRRASSLHGLDSHRLEMVAARCCAVGQIDDRLGNVRWILVTAVRRLRAQKRHSVAGWGSIGRYCARRKQIAKLSFRLAKIAIRSVRVEPHKWGSTGDKSNQVTADSRASVWLRRSRDHVAALFAGLILLAAHSLAGYSRWPPIPAVRGRRPPDCPAFESPSSSRSCRLSGRSSRWQTAGPPGRWGIFA